MDTKRYQVFVSSTYDDLHTERQEVMHALLELDCIPAGMELFPAANEDQWTLIKRVIEDCDYYIVIVGGRYGSLADGEKSYTEAEYRYALAINKPVIAFLHKNPDAIPVGRSEKSPELRQKLAEFRDLCQKKACKYFSSPDELGSVVSRSLIRLIRDNPAVGWVRGNTLTDAQASAEIVRLRRRIEELEVALTSAATVPPPGAENLAQGEDEFEVGYKFATYSSRYGHNSFSGETAVTWNHLLIILGPHLVHEASEDHLKESLEKHLTAELIPGFRKDSEEIAEGTLRSFKIIDSDFQLIKVQLRALGVIRQSQRPRSVKDTGSYWTLTPYGDTLVTQLCAMRRE